MKILRIIGLTLGIGAGLYLLFVTLVVLEPDLTNYSNKTEFDSEKWQNWRESETGMSLRWNMIADLEDDYDLEGMTVKEILDLLGEPDSKSEIQWTYHLGMAGYGIDTGTLTITFDEGKVKSFKTHRG